MLPGSSREGNGEWDEDGGGSLWTANTSLRLGGSQTNQRFISFITTRPRVHSRWSSTNAGRTQREPRVVCALHVCAQQRRMHFEGVKGRQSILVITKKKRLLLLILLLRSAPRPSSFLRQVRDGTRKVPRDRPMVCPRTRIFVCETSAQAVVPSTTQRPIRTCETTETLVPTYYSQVEGALHMPSLYTAILSPVHSGRCRVTPR